MRLVLPRPVVGHCASSRRADRRQPSPGRQRDSRGVDPDRRAYAASDRSRRTTSSASSARHRNVEPRRLPPHASRRRLAPGSRAASLQDQGAVHRPHQGRAAARCRHRGRDGTMASVDSELTLLYRAPAGRPAAGRRTRRQPVLSWTERPMPSARPFTRADRDIYLVTRLDGFTVDDVAGTDRSGRRAQRAPRAAIVLDQKDDARGPRRRRDGCRQAADRLREANEGDRVVLETTRPWPRRPVR